MSYNTCNACAVALVNGDLSALEYSNGIEDMARIEASIEAIGLVTLVKTEDPGSYFECFICDDVCLGNMSTFAEV